MARAQQESKCHIWCVVIVEIEMFARLRGARVSRVDAGIVATTMSRMLRRRGPSAPLSVQVDKWKT